MNINSIFSPIFKLSNNKLIGIYNNKSNIYKKGIFFGLIIKEFVNNYKYYKNTNNEINISVKIDKKDINKKLYFLDNYLIITFFISNIVNILIQF